MGEYSYAEVVFSYRRDTQKLSRRMKSFRKRQATKSYRGDDFISFPLDR